MANKIFLDTESAQKFLGMSAKQFNRAIVMTGIKPFTFPHVMHNTKQFWLRTVLQENRKALVACTGRRGKPRNAQPRPGGNYATRP